MFYQGGFQWLDVRDENESNWLMFVKPARNAMERNLVAFQRNNDIIFITTRDVMADIELLFWFAPDYNKMLGRLVRPKLQGYTGCKRTCSVEQAVSCI